MINYEKTLEKEEWTMKNEYLQIRISEELKEKIRKEAERKGLATSTFLRFLAVEYFNRREKNEKI